uniref:Uncharacterized protein n=1 Tax=Timema cristinae TaxID=61476 RepID=A0A7R9C981_TIMCR|nr:unnamed protein product [Timema cristinae]
MVSVHCASNSEIFVLVITHDSSLTPDTLFLEETLLERDVFSSGCGSPVSKNGNAQNTDTPEIVNDLQTLHGIHIYDVDEWLTKCVGDCETNELNDDKNVAAVSQVHEETINKGPDDDDDELPVQIRIQRACKIMVKSKAIGSFQKPSPPIIYKKKGSSSLSPLYTLLTPPATSVLLKLKLLVSLGTPVCSWASSSCVTHIHEGACPGRSNLFSTSEVAPLTGCLSHSIARLPMTHSKGIGMRGGKKNKMAMNAGYTMSSKTLFPPPPITSTYPHPQHTRYFLHFKSHPSEPRQFPSTTIQWEHLTWYFAEILKQDYLEDENRVGKCCFMINS